MEPYLEQKIAGLCRSNDAKAKMDLYVHIIYSKVASDTLKKIVENNSAAITPSIASFVKTIDWEKLAVERFARTKNLLFYLKQNYITKTLTDKFQGDIEEVISAFFNAELFWRPVGLTLYENFLLFFSAEMKQRSRTRASDFAQVLLVVLLFQYESSNQYSTSSLSEHVDKLETIASFSKDSIIFHTNHYFNTSLSEYLASNTQLNEAVDVKEGEWGATTSLFFTSEKLISA